MRKLISALVAFGLVFSVSLTISIRPAQAADGIIVNTTVDENGSGSACSLREAITSASNQANFGGCVASGAYDSTPTSITLLAGIYTLTVGTELLVSAAINLRGAGAATTFIQANVTPGIADFRIFHFTSSGASTITNVTLRNSGSNHVGGFFYGTGILIEGGGNLTLAGDTTLTDINSNLHNIWAVYNFSGGTLTITDNVRFLNNNSGGIGSDSPVIISGNASFINQTYAVAATSITITGNVLFKNNTRTIHASSGGSISGATFDSNGPWMEGSTISTGGSMTITDSRFINNTGTQGPINVKGTVNISNSLFVGNHAYINGAIFINPFPNSSLTVTNSRFANNQADGNGSIIYQDQGNATFHNNCFVGNNKTTLLDSGRHNGTFDATANWWGSTDGPSGVAPGSGDAIGPNTPFSGFLTSAPAACRTDTIGVFSNGVFELRNSNSTGPADISIIYGNVTDKPVTGDWNSDGIDTIGVYSPSLGLFRLRDSNSPGAPNYVFTFGNPGDAPLAGKWDNTMTHDGVGVYRNSNGILYLRRILSTGFSDYFMIMGNPGDYGLAGDWDADGYDSVGIFRPGNAHFYLSNVNGNGVTFSNVDFDYYPGAGGFPFTGDLTGSGQSSISWLINGTAYIHYPLANGVTNRIFSYGSTGAIPLAGKWVAAPGTSNSNMPHPLSGLVVPSTNWSNAGSSGNAD